MPYLRQRKTRLMAEINVVPYIDVMLVLLVIFMVTAPLLTQGVNVELPEASAKVLPPEAQPPMIVSVDAAGRLFLNVAQKPQLPLSAEQLVGEVTQNLKADAQQHHQRQVYVKGDRRVDYGKVVTTMTLLQQAGVDQVGLITENEESVH